MQPAIVIPGYNRPRTLVRLLASLESVSYPSGIKIPPVISTDWRLACFPNAGSPNNTLHESWSKFHSNDHFPILIKYLTSTNSFYVFPQISLTAGFGATEIHFKSLTSFFRLLPSDTRQTGVRNTFTNFLFELATRFTS